MNIGTVKERIRERISGWAKQRVIRNYEEYCAGKPNRRALLSYLVLPLLPPRRFRDRVKFSNRGIAQEIPRVLNEIGYSVDIVNYDNRSWLPGKDYDLFIGHGGINFERISRRIPDRAPRVYFATGIYWQEWNARNYRRAMDMISRKGVSLSSYRAIENSEESALALSDGIICLGNSKAIDTYKRFPRVIGLNNAVFPAVWDGWRSKDFDKGREHFLFFSGRGNVHKGLDLLLETFSGTNLHLHICQHIERDFADAYRRELTECPNIHVHGFVQMRSHKFYSLAKKCNWVISPTCAEGQPGAVLECMAHGMIPIISEESNIDTKECGVPLTDCSIGTLRSTVTRASGFDVAWIRRMAANTVEETRNQYSIGNFRRNMHQAICKLVDICSR